MKKRFVIGITIIVFLLLGFITAAFLPSEGIACTMMGCPCEGVDGERPCNTCTTSKPVFMLGLFNVAEVCHDSEILVCENNRTADTRIDFDKGRCRLDWYILGTNLKYLLTSPERPASHDIQN
jgi:hypothetical protein